MTVTKTTVDIFLIGYGFKLRKKNAMATTEISKAAQSALVAVQQARPLPTAKHWNNGQLAERNISRAWVEKNPTYSDLERRYNPVNWSYVSREPDKAYTAECPALGALADIYGKDEVAEAWIDTHLTAMFLSSGSKDSDMSSTISAFAASFAQQVRGFKLTELMLFFNNYKAGRYDDSYALFNPTRIGWCFFHKFLPERSAALTRIENERLNRIREQHYANIASGKAMSLTEWQAYKRTHQQQQAEDSHE